MESEKTDADAWIVCSGSRGVLDWFAGENFLTFARLTPPTAALVIEEPPHFFAALQDCAQRGFRVPQDLD